MSITHKKNPLLPAAAILFFLLPVQQICAVFPPSTAQSVNLASMEPGWTSVISGKAVCSPVRTSYGFVVLSDGRTVSACSEKGTILWQKPLKGMPEPYITVTDNDFMYLITDHRNLVLLNPSGYQLWSVQLPFDVSEKPLAGRDGRIFVRGVCGIACFGINGIRKWYMPTEALSALELTELNDGSLLAAVEKTEKGTSEVLRISPFGTLLERIRFTGIVKASASYSSGVLLLFSDGSAGMCSVSTDSGETYTKWSVSRLIPGGGYPVIIRTAADTAAVVCAVQNGVSVTLLDTAAGKSSGHFSVQDINASNLVYFCGDGSGITLSDTKHAVCCLLTSQVKWSASLPDQNTGAKAWNYLYYSSYGTLVLCGTSWALSGYRMSQELSYADKDTMTDCSYMPFYTAASAQTAAADCSPELILTGDYGNNEAAWVSGLISGTDDYIEYRTSKLSNVKENSTDFDSEKLSYSSLFSCMGLFGIRLFQNRIASLITLETDPSYKASLVRTAASCAYDPDGVMLSALEVSLQKAKSSDRDLLCSTCDAVYAICRFMGRPAFNHRGRIMLSALLYCGYDNRVTAYARTTLLKLAALGI